MHRINPAIVTSQEMIYSAVLEGGESTWSFLQEKDGTVFAVGSVHCGLYYGSTHPTLSFVSLPQKVVDLGVEKIGFLEPNNIKNPIPYKNDAMLVQLKKKNLQEKGLVKQYKVISPKKRFSRVAGMSNSGIVSGKNAIFNADDGHYVFVEDFGEAGNSGTLLFGWDGDSNNAKPVGVYFGMFPVGGSSGNNSFRPRGVVAPLPDPKECTWFQPLVTNFPMSFVVTDQKGYKKCTISQGSTGAAACFLKDDGVEWPGVLLKFPSETDKFWYCGSVDMGSRRSK
jgi:hypothetical protein